MTPETMPPLAARVAAGAVHAYTALGGFLAFAALIAVTDGDHERCFLLLVAAYVIDGTDGALARAARCREVLPLFNGEALDLVIDFLTYAFVPLVLLWKGRLLPPPAPLWAAVILVDALYDFGKVHAQKSRGIYTGLIAVWNLYAFYVWALRPSAASQAAAILAITILTFAPLPFVDVSRLPYLRRANVTGLTLWLAVIVLYAVHVIGTTWAKMSLVFPCLYVGEAIWLRLRFGPAAQGLRDR